MTHKGNVTARESNLYMIEDENHWLHLPSFNGTVFKSETDCNCYLREMDVECAYFQFNGVQMAADPDSETGKEEFKNQNSRIKMKSMTSAAGK